MLLFGGIAKQQQSNNHNNLIYETEAKDYTFYKCIY